MANKPKEMKFTIDGFAQRNILKYKDDDTVKGNYSGEITCLISSLEKSREMAELKFAGCDMRGITAFIRLYKYDGEGKAELQKVQPRILLEENNGGLSNGTFTQLSFTDIIKRFYTSFQNAVYTPKIIKKNRNNRKRLERLRYDHSSISGPIWEILCNSIRYSRKYRNSKC